LKVRSSPADPNRMAEGHVVDANGSAVPDALVTTVGVEIEHGSSLIGTIRGLDPLAVTDQSGNFEIFYEKPAEKMLVTIEARTLAMKFATLVTGPERQTIELSNGATVKGRLVQDGKPVGDAEIGLIGKERGGFGAGLEIVGDMYPEMRVGTQQDGTFAISDVPTGVQWLVYAKMESVASRGASKPKACITTRPNEIVDVGDIQLHQGHRLQGKVVLSDGKSVPDGMRFILGSRIVWDTQIASLDRDGRFEFLNLPDGDYSIGPAVRGYSLPGSQDDLQISVQRDIDNLVVTLDPQKKTGVKE
jgi:small nuclear ribonucleoprotein (snRNP)-like protein